jgi:hypothetical protein
MLLSLFILQTFPELLFECSLFNLFHFLVSLYLLHFLFEAFEILIDLFNLGRPSIRPRITLREYLINISNIKLHFQPIMFLLPHLHNLPTHNFVHKLIHLLIGDLPNSIFQDLAIDLAIINIPQELSIVLSEVPEGSLLDPSRHLTDLLLVNVRIGILMKEADK